MTAPAVGIDLGTTYSCVAVCRGGKVDIIPNPNGNRTTPSIVSFGDHRLVGDDARDEATLDNTENTVFDVKRLIGRNYDDPVVQRDREHWPFTVVNEGGRPKIKVTYHGEEKTFYPEEISSMVLNYMKTSAEKYLGKTVRNAVVTVPAYFNDSQRQATKDAATIAGLHVLRIINEPTAGALAYGLENTDDEERNVLIYDLGGGTFDVSILAIEEGIFEVRSTAGNTHLGGADFDSKMVDYFVEEFQRRFSINLKASNYKRELRRLRTACEKAKRKLSSAEEASIALDGMAGNDFHTTITRARFEELCGDMFKATLVCVKEALQEAGLQKDEISDVVLVGGSTRIPAVQKLLREFFDGKKLNKTVNPDEAVALGAALQAAILDGDQSDLVRDLVLVDVTPLSLGIRVREDITSIMIPRNTPIPTKKTKVYTTRYDNQTEVQIDVLEGERYSASDNNLLGTFTLTGIPKAPRGVPKQDVTLEIDENGILTVTAVQTTTKSRNGITIVNEKGRLSKEDIDMMVKQAEMFKRDDEIRKEEEAAKNSLEDFCYTMRNRAKSGVGNNCTEVISRCDAVLAWLRDNSRASKSVYEDKKRELMLVLEMLMMEL